MDEHKDSTNPYAASVTTQAEDLPRKELASRGARLGAAIIDGLITGLPLGIIVFYFMFGANFQTMLQLSFLWSLMIAMLGVGLSILVNGNWIARYGQTVGKRLIGIKIVRMDGSPITLNRWVLWRIMPVRLASNVPVFGPLAALVNVLFIFGDERRCLHDLIADTKVINAN